MTAFHESPLFILGVERSGSTWLANIFDAHPETQLFMEPFAPRIEAFPDFPDRLVYLSEESPFLEEHVTSQFDRLTHYKHPWFHRREGSHLERRFAYGLFYPVSDFVTRGLQVMGVGPPLGHLRFKNLNKNRIENPRLTRLEKSETPSLLVLKELRLNFKVGFLSRLWPQAKALVIIRNPLSQVASMLRLLKDEALHDLRAALYVFLEHAQSCRRFEKYREALDAVSDDHLVHRAVAYWFLNYSTLIEDLQRHEVDHRVVRHEELSQVPAEESRDLLEFAGLEYEEQTETYLRWSSRSSSEEPSVMNTQRDSGSYYLQALRRVDRELRSSFFEAADAFWSHTPEVVRRYRPWLEEHLQEATPS